MYRFVYSQINLTNVYVCFVILLNVMCSVGNAFMPTTARQWLLNYCLILGCHFLTRKHTDVNDIFINQQRETKKTNYICWKCLPNALMLPFIFIRYNGERVRQTEGRCDLIMCHRQSDAAPSNVWCTQDTVVMRIFFLICNIQNDQKHYIKVNKKRHTHKIPPPVPAVECLSFTV